MDRGCLERDFRLRPLGSCGWVWGRTTGRWILRIHQLLGGLIRSTDDSTATAVDHQSAICLGPRSRSGDHAFWVTTPDIDRTRADIAVMAAIGNEPCFVEPF